MRCSSDYSSKKRFPPARNDQLGRKKSKAVRSYYFAVRGWKARRDLRVGAQFCAPSSSGCSFFPDPSRCTLRYGGTHPPGGFKSNQQLTATCAHKPFKMSLLDSRIWRTKELGRFAIILYHLVTRKTMSIRPPWAFKTKYFFCLYSVPSHRNYLQEQDELTRSKNGCATGREWLDHRRLIRRRAD